MRLLGIALASLSSGLGELTFLQLSTTYTSSGVSGEALGYFASGTGCAGLLGAALWWVLRGLGVREGVGISSVESFHLQHPKSQLTFVSIKSAATFHYPAGILPCSSDCNHGCDSRRS